jgi:hypothetical protein
MDQTESLGCLSSYKKGRCDGKDPEDCVYELINSRGADKCSGKFKLLKIPDDFICKD